MQGGKTEGARSGALCLSSVGKDLLLGRQDGWRLAAGTGWLPVIFRRQEEPATEIQAAPEAAAQADAEVEGREDSTRWREHDAPALAGAFFGRDARSRCAVRVFTPSSRDTHSRKSAPTAGTGRGSATSLSELGCKSPHCSRHWRAGRPIRRRLTDRPSTLCFPFQPLLPIPFAASMRRGVLPCPADMDLERVRVHVGTLLQRCRCLSHASSQIRITPTAALHWS